MQFKSYVFYGEIEVRLLSALHIGNDENALVQNGEGKYMIPASSIAGSIRHVIDHPLFGDLKHKSEAYFYDAILKNANVERRVGIARDPQRGTTARMALFRTDYISENATANLRMQFFADDEKEASSLFLKIVNGIQNHSITFGSKKSNGGGIFEVRRASSRVLNLQSETDFTDYCKGIDAVYKTLKSVTVPQMASLNETIYSLRAYVDGSIIVKSDIVPEGKDKEMVPDVQNMYKIGEQGKVYFIPSSTIKGLMRSYAAKILKHQGMSEDYLQIIFGGEVNDTKIAGSIYTTDTIIEDAKPVIYHRVPIDRWLGSTILGQKLDIEALGTDKELKINVRINHKLVDKYKKLLKDYPMEEALSEDDLMHLANALVYLTLRDLGNGRLQLGSYDSIGFGRFKGTSLRVNGKECSIKDGIVDCSHIEKDLEAHLQVLGGVAHGN